MFPEGVNNLLHMFLAPIVGSLSDSIGRRNLHAIGRLGPAMWFLGLCGAIPATFQPTFQLIFDAFHPHCACFLTLFVHVLGSFFRAFLILPSQA